MNNTIDLDKKELVLINGGGTSFGWDMGWLLGNILAGNFSNINVGSSSVALAKYALAQEGIL